MAPTTWGDLPPEVILKICELLYHTRYSSLVSFARTNKAHYTSAAIFLFRALRIVRNDAETLALDVQQHLERLHRDNAFQHVRQLIIFAQPPEVRYRGYLSSIRSRPTQPPSSHDKLPPMRDVDFDCRFNNLGSIYPGNASDARYFFNADSDWEPLADLIKQVRHLTDLIYHRPGLVPIRVLLALEEHHPKCRLHIDDFQLHSLATKQPSSNSDEFMVATSPCLYSINLELGSYPVRDAPHVMPAVQRIASGLAPNLKEVHLHSSRSAGDSWRADEDHPLSYPLWERLGMAQTPQEASGSLSCLHLYGPRNEKIVQESFLANWSLHTDFSVLQTLRIESQISEGALDYLASAPHDFPSLKTLVLVFKQPQDSEEPESISQYYETATRFFSGLQGLETLEITWWHRDIDLRTILYSELQTLVLRCCRNEHLTARDVTQIRKRCPFLTDLTLMILRSKGDAEEMAVYKELGRLPRLQQLCLEMDALLPPFSWDGYDDLPPDPSFDAYDRERSDFSFYLNGHFRDAFINGAMDGNLALDIFETISRAKPNGDSTPLEKLVIRFPPRLDAFPANHLGRYRTAFRRTWQVQRSLRDDAYLPLVAQELVKENRDESEDDIYDGMRNNIDTIFRRIWPERLRDSDWRADWHSFPISSHRAVIRATARPALPRASRRPQSLGMRGNHVRILLPRRLSPD
ncbi:hypothetical protein F5Y06DRAFT_259285 [Hypoxylon sp. FL0890]|nr:hypothetical protein F5Y06DRAFT_259285 [Hypoxylon sp. FL0890]